MNLRLLLAFFFAAIGCGKAQEAVSRMQAASLLNYTAECQMVVVPARLVPALTEDLGDETKCVAAWARVQAMIARGEATLSEYLMGRGYQGEWTEIGTNLKIRYPVEYATPALLTTQPLDVRGQELVQHWPYVGLTPSVFEGREVGPSLALKVTRTADPRVVTGVCACTHTRFEHWRKAEAGRLPSGERFVVEQPDFGRFHIETETCFTNGQPKLLSAHRLPGAEGRFELAVVTLRFTPRAIEAPAAPPAGRVRVELPMISVPLNEGRRLVPQLQKSQTFAAAETRLRALLASGVAELLAYPTGECVSGGKVGVSTFREVHSAIEFEPPSAGLPWPPPPSTKLAPALPDPLFAFGVPIGFESRNTGPEVQWEAIVETATGGIDLNLNLRDEHFEEHEPAIGARSDRPELHRMLKPRSSAWEFQSACRVPVGGRMLLSQRVLQQPEPRLVLFLLHARAYPPPRSP